ncbi:2-dehydropantoate 2-reductase [Corynespora cassiicola Philippines]|uniref:2-dehydropantoate 2-reductase n=1 Tax=Corynespora cassiicola Philippines TaxID=1448308 RepID=A0A2T2NQB9_CORCC|nr:2-dehydropantoate 2-reductase [Corynespora cassiicola Philippines]
MGCENKPRILIFGTGSVGAIYAYVLLKVASVTAVCRSNYDVVKEKGFVLNSTLFGQNINFKPNVVRSCAEAAADDNPFDYILVCSKSFPGGTIPQIIAPAVTPGKTAIVLVQNGIGIEEEYRKAFPQNPIVSGVVYLPTAQRPAGVITHGEIAKLQLGSYPSSSSPEHAQALVNLLQAGETTAEFCEDVQYQRWFKLIVNVSWNPLCALARSTDVQLMVSSPTATDLVRAIMMEVRDIAKAYGHDITKEQVDFQLGRAEARIPTNNAVEPSMLQDVKEGRRMEVEAILGNTLKLAKEKEVECPRIEMLYVLTKALDLRLGEFN